MANIVFIGVSLDGYITDRNGGLDFLQSVTNPEHNELGFPDFMDSIDGLLMGRKPMKPFSGSGTLSGKRWKLVNKSLLVV